MPRVFVSIGSNIDRDRNVQSALAALARNFGAVRASTVYQCPAEGFVGDDFYNLVVVFETTESIEDLHARLAEIETAHGRTRDGPRFGPRPLDLDILLYGSLVRHDEHFDVPRGEIREHAFVIEPLAEIAPAERHPETGETFEALWAAFRRDHPEKCRLRPVALQR